jgi:hypothetical protein
MHLVQRRQITFISELILWNYLDHFNGRGSWWCDLFHMLSTELYFLSVFMLCVVTHKEKTIFVTRTDRKWKVSWPRTEETITYPPPSFTAHRTLRSLWAGQQACTGRFQFSTFPNPCPENIHALLSPSVSVSCFILATCSLVWNWNVLHQLRHWSLGHKPVVQLGGQRTFSRWSLVAGTRVCLWRKHWVPHPVPLPLCFLVTMKWAAASTLCYLPLRSALPRPKGKRAKQQWTEMP